MELSNFGKILGASADLYGGVSTMIDMYDSASALREQGALAKQDYFRQAKLIREEGTKTRAKQTMEYISSGVGIGGTSLLVLKETMSKANAVASSYEQAGINTQNLYNSKASVKKNEGASSIISGVLTAASLLL